MGKKDSGKGGSGASNKMLPLLPMQIGFSPNAALGDRPVVALTVAVLCNVAPDYTLVSDHHRSVPEAKVGSGVKKVVRGDLCIARAIARSCQRADELVDVAEIEQWTDYANAIKYNRSLAFTEKVRIVTATLDRALLASTYVSGHDLTVGDLALFAVLGWPVEAVALSSLLASTSSSLSSPSARWLRTVATHPAVREATQMAVGVAGNAEAQFDENNNSNPMEALVAGMNPLSGATAGRVCTRFPPEPSGYLHIGHAKAVLLNDYYARRYQGRLVVRFDDTNPEKEKDEYQQSIATDLRDRLGIDPQAVFTFTSDYFDVIKDYAVHTLIETGQAFMDDTPQEQMQKERMDRVESQRRNQSVQECKERFDEMCSGSDEGSRWCLRIKMDMTSDNGTLRDPVVYRQNNTPHHRTGTTHHAYPTYDLACPIVDALEGVTHALRTTEYNDRDAQYAWIQRVLGLRRVRIHAFARMNFTYTELSKRKLAWFVDQNLVDGWNDARFPTIQGVIRRGLHVPALRAFICSQGASRNVVNMEMHKLWAENKKYIDKTAPRYMAIDDKDHVVIDIHNDDDPSDHSFVTTAYHPKDPSMGVRALRVGKSVMIEAVDAQGMQVDECIVLMHWGVFRITSVPSDQNTHYAAVFVPDGDFKAAKRKLTWLTVHPSNVRATVVEFDHLVTKAKIEPEDDFKDYLNPVTKAESTVWGDAGLKDLRTNDVIQLERRGYFRVDQAHINDNGTSNNGLVLFMVPDGKTKAMSGLQGKLAHH